MKKLVSEIRRTFTSDADITLVNTGNMKYLMAVLEGGLRIYPPVPCGLP